MLSIDRSSCYMFNLDCRFNHVSFVWRNAKFNAEVNKHYCKLQDMGSFIKVFKYNACLFNENLIIW